MFELSHPPGKIESASIQLRCFDSGFPTPLPQNFTFLIGVLCLLLFAHPSSVASDPGSTPAVSDRVPVQAELIKTVEAGKVRIGDSVYARVDLPWKNPACELREGSILKGRVVIDLPKGKSAKSEVALLFESGQCNGRDMKPLPLTIAAVLAPDPNSNSSLYGNQQSPPLSSATGLGLGQEGTGSPMRSMLAAAATVILEPPVNKPPVLVMPGQVIGLRNMHLEVGSGPDGSSVLSSEKHNLRLESGSRLVLVPTVSTPAPPPSANAPPSSRDIASDVPSVAPDVDNFEEADSCASANCGSFDESLPEVSLTSAGAVPIASLGFFSAADREMYDLTHDETISYLGPNRLLLTFNPHVLVVRTANDNKLPKLHMVRATLIDVKTLRVVRTVDWRAYDAQQYVWPLGTNTVLVHVGSELREYNSDLQIEHKLSLNGSLAFVRVAPSGKYFVAGIIRERHSEAIHHELSEAEGHEPEEDVEIRVFNPAFDVQASVVRSSREVPPVLTDEGEIRIPTIGKDRWRISEYTWTGQRRILKQFASGCIPETQSVPPDLLLITGCDQVDDTKWFRLLRSDGKSILRGHFSSSERGSSKSGIEEGLVALGTEEMTKSVATSAAFRSSNLKELRVTIYAADSGKRITAVTVSNPLPSAQSFALSPNGQQLAVLNSTHILFYAMPGLARH